MAYQIVLNDGQKFAITDPVEQTSVSYKGSPVKAIKFTFADKSLSSAAIKTAFTDETAVAELKIQCEDGKIAATYTNYSVLAKIEQDVDTDLYSVYMRETSDLPALVASLQDEVNKANEKINNNAENAQYKFDEITKSVSEVKTAVDDQKTSVDESLQSVEKTLSDHAKDIEDLQPKEIVVADLPVDEAKAYRINESKEALAKFLEENGVTSSCHGGVSKVYSVTAEKQQYLTQMISMISLAKASETEFQPSWNAKGETCTYDWTAEELTQLSFEIEAYVRPRVSKQQAYESQINACATTEEVCAIVIDYASI
ncbi:MAG TPA: hypothetical protein DCW90_07170 [Lachnospiraceae bacterium]|nr:hypothetical protein [Lachnospiraceae bacterium]